MAYVRVSDATPAIGNQNQQPLNPTIKMLSFAISQLLAAIHMAANSGFFVRLGQPEEKAGAIVSAGQSLVLGAGTGILLSCGLGLSEARSSANYARAGVIIRSALLLSIFLSIIGILMFISTYWSMHLFYDKEIAEAAAKFFMGSTIPLMPIFGMVVANQVFFNANYWVLPLLANVFFRTVAVALTYVFTQCLSLGELGIGYAGGIAGWLSFLSITAWFYVKHFHFYQLNSWIIPGARAQICLQLSKGWKLALQRLSEWAHLAILALVIGKWGDDKLKAESVVVQIIVILAIFAQGLGQGLGMYLSENRGKLKAILNNTALPISEEISAQRREIYKQNWHGIVKVMSIGTALNLGLSILAACLYQEIIKLTVPGSMDKDASDLVKNLLWINALSVSFDTLRISAYGALRGWDDLLQPMLVNMVSLLSGVGLGIGLGFGMDQSLAGLLYGRLVGLVIAAVATCGRLYFKIKADNAMIGNSLLMLPSANPALGYQAAAMAIN